MVKKDQFKKGHWGARMYLHSVVAKAKLRQSAYPSGVSLDSQAHDPRSAEKAGVVWMLLSGLYAINREGAPCPRTHKPCLALMTLLSQYPLFGVGDVLQ